MYGLTAENIVINRKALSELAQNEPESFKARARERSTCGTCLLTLILRRWWRRHAEDKLAWTWHNTCARSTASKRPAPDGDCDAQQATQT